MYGSVKVFSPNELANRDVVMRIILQLPTILGSKYIAYRNGLSRDFEPVTA